MVRGLGQRQADHDHVGLAEQLRHPVRLPDFLDPERRGNVLDVDREQPHAEGPRALRDRVAGAAEAHDAERLVVDLPLLPADGLAQGVVGLADGRVQSARECQQERYRVLGQMDADLALLAGQDDVALDQVRREDRVHAGADRVVVADALAQHEDVVGHAPEDHVGVGDLRALAGLILGVHDAGAGTGRGQDA